MASKSDNRPPIEIPAGDMAKATRWVYARAHRLSKEKRAISEDISQRLKDAKGEGAPVAAVRQAARLRRMSPEKRIAWESTINSAAAFLGYAPLVPADMPPDMREIAHGGHVEAVQLLEQDRAEISKQIAETYAAAKDVGVDVASVRLFVRMSNMDNIELKDWFDSVDMTGKTLGAWDANFDDLHSEFA